MCDVLLLGEHVPVEAIAEHHGLIDGAIIDNHPVQFILVIKSLKVLCWLHEQIGQRVGALGTFEERRDEEVRLVHLVQLHCLSMCKEWQD